MKFNANGFIFTSGTHNYPVRLFIANIIDLLCPQNNAYNKLKLMVFTSSAYVSSSSFSSSSSASLRGSSELSKPSNSSSSPSCE